MSRRERGRGQETGTEDKVGWEDVKREKLPREKPFRRI